RPEPVAYELLPDRDTNALVVLTIPDHPLVPDQDGDRHKIWVVGVVMHMGLFDLTDLDLPVSRFKALLVVNQPSG
ncbi:MAG: hypothetical protein WC119_12140, partial [Synergistaceae bacterium]